MHRVCRVLGFLRGTGPVVLLRSCCGDPEFVLAQLNLPTGQSLVPSVPAFLAGMDVNPTCGTTSNGFFLVITTLYTDPTDVLAGVLDFFCPILHILFCFCSF